MSNMNRNKSNTKFDMKNLNLNRLSNVNLKKLKQLENLSDLLTMDTPIASVDLKSNFEVTVENKGILNLHEDENIL